jgi:hypothetical protein
LLATKPLGPAPFRGPSFDQKAASTVCQGHEAGAFHGRSGYSQGLSSNARHTDDSVCGAGVSEQAVRVVWWLTAAVVSEYQRYVGLRLIIKGIVFSELQHSGK